MDSDDETDSGSSCSDSDEESVETRMEIDVGSKFLLFITLQSILSLEGDRMLPKYSIRRGNVHRERSLILRWAAELDDKMFNRQFRVCREDFFYILMRIQPALRKKTRQAINSSGSEISPELMLMITLRILAGASYLDMIHYRVHVDSVSSIVWNTVVAIHDRLDNIKLALTDIDCLTLAKEWASIQLIRWGQHLTVGTIYAGDGLAIEIAQPTVSDLSNRPLSVFRNRKGFWAIIAQGFCDAYTRFGVFDVKWPGGTNDIIAYQMTDIYKRATDNLFPPWATFVLDEAYSSCGGMHLTPFSFNQLRRAKETNELQYRKMLAFNNVLSSQRITIERAFGILVRRWGILWRPIAFNLAKAATIARVCAMLHNVCVDRWKLNKPSPYTNRRRRWPDVPEQYLVEDSMPNDESIILRMHNTYSTARSSNNSALRQRMMEDIYDAGIVSTSDTEFHNWD